MVKFFRRFYFGNYQFSFLLMKIQQVKGIANKVLDEKDKYFIFWDIENCSLEECKESLKSAQMTFKLADIFITSDTERSFRAYCFSKRPFIEYLRILTYTQHVDYAFIKWTVIRHKSVLRVTKKYGRPKQIVICKLEGYEPYDYPKEMLEEIYETGLTKYPIVETMFIRR